MKRKRKDWKAGGRKRHYIHSPYTDMVICNQFMEKGDKTKGKQMERKKKE